MPLKDDLQESKKLDSRLKMQLHKLPENVDPDKPLFSLFIQGSEKLDIPDIQIGTRAGTIYTAHNVSLNGLKKLIDSPHVFYLQGSHRLYPDSGPKGPLL